MEPLFHALYHGCNAGRHAECLVEVYRDRVLRGDECYLSVSGEVLADERVAVDRLRGVCG